MSPQAILNEIAELRQLVINKEAELTVLQSRCTHSWGAPQLCPEREISDNILRAFGIHRTPCWFHSPMWSRQCQYCLKTEHTTHVKTTEEPDFTPRGEETVFMA